MDYIGRALEAERLARQISYEPDRQALLEIARHWRKLADRLVNPPDREQDPLLDRQAR